MKRDEEAFEADGFPDHLRGPEEVRDYFQRVVEHNVQIRELVQLYSVLGAGAIASGHPAHDYFALRTVWRWAR